MSTKSINVPDARNTNLTSTIEVVADSNVISEGRNESLVAACVLDPLTPVPPSGRASS